MYTNAELIIVSANLMLVMLENKFGRLEIKNMQTPLSHQTYYIYSDIFVLFQ
jgi:hypothetical protein